MKNIFNAFLILLFSIALNGCATSNRENTMNSWLGATVEQLVSVWGPPTNSYSANDTTTISYYKSTIMQTTFGIIPMSCNTIFTAKNGYIYNWSYSGNGCR